METRTVTADRGYGEAGSTETCTISADLQPLLPVVTGFPPSAREAGTSVETFLARFGPGWID